MVVMNSFALSIVTLLEIIQYTLIRIHPQLNQECHNGSRKLKFSARNFTTTEQELLSIVETLKEFMNITLVQRIKVFTDH